MFASSQSIKNWYENNLQKSMVVGVRLVYRIDWGVDNTKNGKVYNLYIQRQYEMTRQR
jgi:hypothetical protein